jgi:hypothetical protein
VSPPVQEERENPEKLRGGIAEDLWAIMALFILEWSRWGVWSNEHFYNSVGRIRQVGITRSTINRENSPHCRQQVRLAFHEADVRNEGIPTIAADALDAEVILATCTLTIGQPGDPMISMTVAGGRFAHCCDSSDKEHDHLRPRLTASRIIRRVIKPIHGASGATIRG